MHAVDRFNGGDCGDVFHEQQQLDGKSTGDAHVGVIDVESPNYIKPASLSYNDNEFDFESFLRM